MPELSVDPAVRAEPSSPERLWGNWRLRHLPVVLAVSVAVLVVAAVTGGVTSGASGAVGAAVGVAVVVASYLVSTLVIAWADSVQSSLVFPFGMVTYLLKCTVIGAAMVAVASSGWPGLVPMGWGVAAGVLAWTTSQVWWTVRTGPPGSPRRTDSVVRPE